MSSLSEDLPQDLNNLIESYTTEEKYKDDFINSNTKAKKDVLFNELKDIDMDLIINFKLAKQLAENYIQNSNKKMYNYLNIQSLTGIFLPLLNTYKYEQLLNTEKLDVPDINIQYNTEREKSISKYIFNLKEEFLYFNYPNRDKYKTQILPLLNKQLSDRIIHAIKFYGKDRFDFGQLFGEAYIEMIMDKDKNNTSPHKHWSKYIKIYEKYLEENLINICLELDEEDEEEENEDNEDEDAESDEEDEDNSNYQHIKEHY
jgi:hypothetical protein